MGYVAPISILRQSQAKENDSYEFGSNLKPGGANVIIRKGSDNAGGTLVVEGNLTVEGSTTLINSTVLNVVDDIIVARYNLGTDGSGGLDVQQSGTSAAKFLYDSTDNKFKIGFGTVNSTTIDSLGILKVDELQANSISGLTTPLSVSQGGTGLSVVGADGEILASDGVGYTFRSISSFLTAGTGISLSGTTNVNISQIEDSVTQKVRISKNGALIGTRREINFVEGSNVTLTVNDNAGANRVDITISSTGGGGGGIGGSGTIDFIPKFTSSTSIGDSIIKEASNNSISIATFLVLSASGLSGIKTYTFPNISGNSDEVVTTVAIQSLANKTLYSPVLANATAKAFVFTGTTNILETISNIVYTGLDGTYKVGFGTSNPENALHIYKDARAPVTGFNDTEILLERTENTGIGGVLRTKYRRFSGNELRPIQNGDVITRIVGIGQFATGGAGEDEAARIDFVATGNWSSSSEPVDIVFYITEATTPFNKVERFRIRQDGNLVINSNLILSASGLSAQRTYTFPDVSDTVVTTTAVQTLTNKTLDDPVFINTFLDDLNDVVITGPSVGQVLKYDGTNWVNGSIPGVTPGGSDGAIQFNDSGSFGGETGGLFNWDKTNKRLTIGGNSSSVAGPALILEFDNANKTWLRLRRNGMDKLDINSLEGVDNYVVFKAASTVSKVAVMVNATNADNYFFAVKDGGGVDRIRLTSAGLVDCYSIFLRSIRTIVANGDLSIETNTTGKISFVVNSILVAKFETNGDFLMVGNRNWIPDGDNRGKVGTNTNRFAEVNAVVVNAGDFKFANGYYLTEDYENGGIKLCRPDGSVVTSWR